MYPTFARDPQRWLDGEGGRGSIAAGAMRVADTEGLLRASAWSPGLANPEFDEVPISNSEGISYACIRVRNVQLLQAGSKMTLSYQIEIKLGTPHKKSFNEYIYIHI